MATGWLPVGLRVASGWLAGGFGSFSMSKVQRRMLDVGCWMLRSSLLPTRPTSRLDPTTVAPSEFLPDGRLRLSGSHFQHPQPSRNAAVAVAAIFRVAGALEQEPHPGWVHRHALIHANTQEFAVADIEPSTPAPVAHSRRRQTAWPVNPPGSARVLPSAPPDRPCSNGARRPVPRRW